MCSTYLLSCSSMVKRKIMSSGKSIFLSSSLSMSLNTLRQSETSFSFDLSMFRTFSNFSKLILPFLVSGSVDLFIIIWIIFNLQKHQYSFSKSSFKELKNNQTMHQKDSKCYQFLQQRLIAVLSRSVTLKMWSMSQGGASSNILLSIWPIARFLKHLTFLVLEKLLVW